MAMDDVQKLNLDGILTLIEGQLREYMNSEENYEKYKKLNVFMSKEQQFIKIKDKDPNALYIVVKFGAADVVFGQTVLPASIVALGPQNTLEIVQSLFFEYVQKYNQTRVLDNTIQQFYDSPEVLENFNSVYEGYRNTISMSAAFVIGTNSNEYTVYYYKAGDDGNFYANKVPVISTSFAYVANPDTQAFYNSRDFTRSEMGFGGVTVGFSTFIFNNNDLINDVLDVFGTKGDGKTYILADNTSKVQLSLSNPSDTAIKTALGELKNEDNSAKYPASMWNNLSVIVTNNDTLWRYEGTEAGGSWVEKEVLAWLPATSVYPMEGSPVNQRYRLGIVFRDDKHVRIGNFKLTNMTSSQELEQIPVIAVAFVE